MRTENDNTEDAQKEESCSAGIQTERRSLKAQPPHPALKILVQTMAKEAARDWFERHQAASNDN